MPTRLEWPLTLALWGFFLLDWLLLYLLPIAGRSYGPPQPPVLLLALIRALFAWLPPWVMLPLQIIGTLLVIYGFWFEPLRITVTRERLQSPKLAPGTTIRILHLGDLHIERITAREKKLNELVQEFQSDIILFSGDVLNLSYLREPKAIAEAREVMARWKATHGVFAVEGSPAVDIAESIPKIYTGLEIRLMKEERRTIELFGQEIDLIGLSCSHRPHVDAPRLERLVDDLTGRFTILLYHSPDLAPNAAEHNIDLMLSGHTHGGQVRLPFFGALFTASLYGRIFASGRYGLKNLTLYITRGLGMEGAGAPRVRFLCPPEVILWEISGG